MNGGRDAEEDGRKEERENMNGGRGNGEDGNGRWGGALREGGFEKREREWREGGM